MRFFVFAACVLAGTVPAAASGGLGCEASDKSVKISIESGVTRGMGSPVFNFRGRLEILAKTVAWDLRKTEFTDQHLPQYWLDENGLKLLLYREREGDKPHGYVELLVDTKTEDDEGSLKGAYRLTVFDTADDASGQGKTASFSGKVSCFVE